MASEELVITQDLGARSELIVNNICASLHGYPILYNNISYGEVWIRLI